MSEKKNTKAVEKAGKGKEQTPSVSPEQMDKGCFI